jgi:hypothetical protein
VLKIIMDDDFQLGVFALQKLQLKPSTSGVHAASVCILKYGNCPPFLYSLGASVFV